MDRERVDVVLVRPARPANVAAAARAMKNMGLRRLRLVTPPAGLGEFDQRAAAYGAFDVLDGAIATDSLAVALADCAFAVAASGRGGPSAWTPRQLGQRAAERSHGGRLAIVFGPEASGLTNAELRLCQAVVTIPTDSGHTSLNLAQAVLVVAYELFLACAGLGDPLPESPETAAAANIGELETAIAELREGLIGIGYLNPASPEPITAELRRLLSRARPTLREVGLLRGMARQVVWAGGQVAQARRLREKGE